MPYLALAEGVSNKTWARSWIAARAANNFRADPRSSCLHKRDDMATTTLCGVICVEFSAFVFVTSSSTFVARSTSVEHMRAV
eukprot:5690886-Amphidinium_carterae.1